MTFAEWVFAVGLLSFLVMLTKFIIELRRERRERELQPKPPRREPIWKHPEPPEVTPRDTK